MGAACDNVALGRLPRAALQLAGKPAIMTSAMDPFDDFSGGLLKLTNSTGRREGVTGASATLASLTGGYTLFDSADYAGSYSAPTDHTFAKANGLGDIEALCDPRRLKLATGFGVTVTATVSRSR
ncbi:MAG: hypothetical protein R2932_55415 [Caldilineaceae bacterium]